MSMTIEIPTIDDLQEISALYKETWLATYPNVEHGITVEDIEAWFSKEETEQWIKKRKENFAAHLADKTAYFKIARLDGKIVGVCGGENKASGVHLKSIYVLPSYQGKGVGSALLKDFFDWVGEHQDLTVHVAVYNAQAIAFYESKGFVDTGQTFSEERFKMKSGNSIVETEMIRKRLK